MKKIIILVVVVIAVGAIMYAVGFGQGKKKALKASTVPAEKAEDTTEETAATT